MDNNQNAAEKCDAMHNTVHAQCQSVANISSGCASCLLFLQINIHPLC